MSSDVLEIEMEIYIAPNIPIEKLRDVAGILEGNRHRGSGVMFDEETGEVILSVQPKRGEA